MTHIFRNKFLLSATASILLNLVAANAQSIRTYDVTSGLSANSIKDMLQDPYGYIWFASQDGLNVFNGVTFKSYGCSYRSTCSDEVRALNVLAIHQHLDGRRIWVATQSDVLLLFDPDSEAFRKSSLRDISEEFQPNLCFAMEYDRDGRLWCGTDSGICIFDENSASFKYFTTGNSGLLSDFVQCLFCDSNGVMWVGTDRGLERYNPVTDSFTAIPFGDGTIPGGGSPHIASIKEGHTGTLWVGMWNSGLAKLDKGRGILKFLSPSCDVPIPQNLRVRNILVGDSDELWLCTSVGFFKYCIPDNTMNQVVLSSMQPMDNVYCCLRDSEGGLWIGTFFKGVYYIASRARQVECYTLENVTGALNGSAISSFCEDAGGNIWVASENGGLSIFDPTRKKFGVSSWHSADDNLHALCVSGNMLYVGTFGKGLREMDIVTGHIRSFVSSDHPHIISDNIFSLFCHENRLFVGTNQGCSVFDTDRKVFTEISQLAGEFVYDISRDASGCTWFASYYNGLFRHGPAEDEWHHYRHAGNDGTSLPNDKVLDVYVDGRERIWVCTEGGGICRYAPESDSFERVMLSFDGQETDPGIVYGLLDDMDGNLWISSNNGIWTIDADGLVLRHFTHEDGLQSNQYNFGASFKSSTGKLYFGGVNGFNVFDPENIHDTGIMSPVTSSIHYTDVDGSVVVCGKSADGGYARIPRKVPSFTVDFECLSFSAPSRNVFAYRIDGADDWTMTHETSVTFLNFPHGKHTIEVKARNGEMLWSSDVSVLHINNLPPVWRSVVAEALYLAVGILAFIWILTFYEKRRKEKMALKIREIKSAQEAQAYAAKINFFTHVAHEIKTPVTLIKAPLEVIVRNEKDQENRRNLEIIGKNSDRLLSLVNQLLDFKKISSDGYEPTMRECDPSHIVGNVAERFSALPSGVAKIDTVLPEGPVLCMLDPEAYSKIVSNLLSNAIKHAHSLVKLVLTLEDGHNGKMLRLSVGDDGEGIPESEESNIFNSFYQIGDDARKTGGFGIGLSLVKLLVEKHGGRVYVDRTKPKGCTMNVDIPFISARSLRNEEVTEEREESNSSDGQRRLKILITEDTADMLDFISSALGDGNVIYKASNGREGLELLHRYEVDIVISDISMPVMDGFEMLREIRKDDLLCHIPVIMLTVEDSLESKIKGLEYGADAYIEKPFSTYHLLATVESLIRRRELMRKHFLGSETRSEADNLASARDNEWFGRVRELVESNIQEPEISVDELAAEMNLSRSSFQRKIKGLTGLPPVEFIRMIRLKKAAELLSSGKYRVNEVCYLVGFNKPSYFSALFKKQFGVQPKDYRG